MTDNIIDNLYLKDTYENMDFEPEPAGKIIFLFFSPEKDAYIRWLRTHNRRTATADTYKAQLNAMMPVVLDTLGYFRFDEIGEDEIYALIEAFHGRICGRSIKTYIETFGRLIYFVTGSNPVKRSQILWDDCEPTNCVFINEEDWPRIKASAKSITDRLILALGAYLALRREEMVRIRMQDIQWPNIVIHGKGHGPEGKVILRPIPEPLRVILKQYITERERLHPNTDQLLIRIDGKRKGKAMTGSSVRYACDQMVKRCGIKFTPHSLRRLHGTTIWETSGHDLSISMQSTRHESADVFLNCYVKRNPKKVQEAVDKLCGIL